MSWPVLRRIVLSLLVLTSALGVPSLGGNWIRTEHMDKMTDQKSVVFRVDGSTIIVLVHCSPAPIVALRLLGIDNVLKLDECIDCEPQKDWASVTYRVDEQEPVSKRMQATSGLILEVGEASGGPSEFLRSMSGRDSLVVTLPRQGRSSAAERFDISGLDRVLEAEPLCDLHESPGSVEMILGHVEDATAQANQGEPYTGAVGDVTPPRLIRQVQPKYPKKARADRLEGNVILQAVLQKNGRVGEAVVLRCSRPNIGFEKAALKAVRQWRYEPAQKDGTPVDVYFTVFVEFELH